MVCLRGKPPDNQNSPKSLNMKSNVSNIDRIIRIVAAIVLAALFFTGTVTGTVGYILLAVAAIFLVTGAINFCPLYRVLGISTRKG